MTDEVQGDMALKGAFLIAMPALKDPNFFHSVVCICEYTASGTLGLVVNQLYPSLLAKDVFQELNIDYLPERGEMPLYNGGPVNGGDVFVLHGPPFDWGGSFRITDDLAMTNTKDILEAIAVGNGPDLHMIVLGCAGWSGGQLESELKGNFWLTASLDVSIMFDVPVGRRWEEGMRRLNIDPALLSGISGNA
ncbi:MAG: YqgE/AlgH family protein [Thermodesulfobacteriota bacterium]|nr:YqgE/AlgH family protein [Thermodesulfobacteriota bacterium]